MSKHSDGTIKTMHFGQAPALGQGALGLFGSRFPLGNSPAAKLGKLNGGQNLSVTFPA